jgi:hypothetical protein
MTSLQLFGVIGSVIIFLSKALKTTVQLLTSIKDAAIETPFTILLHEDSEHPLPDTNDYVAADHKNYSVSFEKKKRPPKLAE